MVGGKKFREDHLLKREYLKKELDSNYEERNYEEANMFLAEDRILCLGIFC